jgi:hypothetical protein
MRKLVPESAQGEILERRLCGTQLRGACDLLAIAVVLPLPTIFALYSLYVKLRRFIEGNLVRLDIALVLSLASEIVNTVDAERAHLADCFLP